MITAVILRFKQFLTQQITRLTEYFLELYLFYNYVLILHEALCLVPCSLILLFSFQNTDELLERRLCASISVFLWDVCKSHLHWGISDGMQKLNILNWGSSEWDTLRAPKQNQIFARSILPPTASSCLLRNMQISLHSLI